MKADPDKKSLIIVESPTKAKTISKYLPSTCIVIASQGHIADLKSVSSLGVYGVDTEHDFALDYEYYPEKEKIRLEMKEKLKSVEQLILASDEDREGESIAWHVKNYLKPDVPVYRMVFHEITKKAITSAFDSCRDINMNLVYSQEARRAVDRLQGYCISSLLSSKLGSRYSAGRVQSPSLKKVVEKEKERMNYKKTNYYSLSFTFTKDNKDFIATLSKIREKDVASSSSFDSLSGKVKGDVIILSKEEGCKIIEELKGKNFKVIEVKDTTRSDKPPYPFITSTLQQDATRKFNMSAKSVMSIAQSLYEKGFITYMRTDSPTLSEECLRSCKDYITKNYGDEYYEMRQYKAKSLGAQEAHEAIRPAGESMRTPEETGLSGNELKLYTLIWKRTLSSQMKNSIRKITSVKIKEGEYTFSSSGSVVTFLGFKKVYSETEGEEENSLPYLKEGDNIDCRGAEVKEHESEPPRRYSEATLIEELEREEIGRPSTYATIISTLIDRKYVLRQGGILIPTFLGFFVDEFLENAFSHYIDYDFTKDMEAGLDKIASGQLEKKEYLSEFWFGKSRSNVGLKRDIEKAKASVVASDIKTLRLPNLTYTFSYDERDVHYQIKTGKFGPYLLLDQKEGGKDVMKSIPEDEMPGTFTDQEAKKIAYPESSPEDAMYGKYYLKKGRYGYYFERISDKKIVSWPKEVKNKKPKDAEERYIDLLMELPKVIKKDKNGEDIVLKCGSYGVYLVLNGKNVSVKDPFNIDIDSLLNDCDNTSSLSGEYEGESFILKKGAYGEYIKWGNKNISLNDEEKKNVTQLKKEDIIEIIKRDKESKKGEKEFTPYEGEVPLLINGKFGFYVKWGKENIALPDEIRKDISLLNDEKVRKLIDDNKGKRKTSRKWKKQ